VRGLTHSSRYPPESPGADPRHKNPSRHSHGHLCAGVVTFLYRRRQPTARSSLPGLKIIQGHAHSPQISNRGYCPRLALHGSMQNPRKGSGTRPFRGSLFRAQNRSGMIRIKCQGHLTICLILPRVCDRAAIGNFKAVYLRRRDPAGRWCRWPNLREPDSAYERDRSPSPMGLRGRQHFAKIAASTAAVARRIVTSTGKQQHHHGVKPKPQFGQAQRSHAWGASCFAPSCASAACHQPQQ